MDLGRRAERSEKRPQMQNWGSGGGVCRHRREEELLVALTFGLHLKPGPVIEGIGNRAEVSHRLPLNAQKVLGYLGKVTFSQIPDAESECGGYDIQNPT